MKTLRNLTCAIAALAVVAFYAPWARAIPLSGITTNYDVLNITATIQTNITTMPKTNVTVHTVHTFALNNAAILSLLEGKDWNAGPFPPGSKLVVSWDAGENVTGGEAEDILVVDKTGTNVLYDASEESWSNFGNASMTVSFFNQFGANKLNYNTNAIGGLDFTAFDTTSFEINDGENPQNLFIDATGPSTTVGTQGWKDLASNDFTSWSDSQHATTYGAGTNVFINGSINNNGVTVKISASGHGKGVGGYYDGAVYLQ